jgi:tRNA A37 threonylcarbamoyladenosine dehydratase
MHQLVEHSKLNILRAKYMQNLRQPRAPEHTQLKFKKKKNVPVVFPSETPTKHKPKTKNKTQANQPTAQTCVFARLHHSCVRIAQGEFENGALYILT